MWQSLEGTSIFPEATFLGIVNGEDFQILYSDTPGILKPNYKLQQSMMKFVDSAISDADWSYPPNWFGSPALGCTDTG